METEGSTQALGSGGARGGEPGCSQPLARSPPNGGQHGEPQMCRHHNPIRHVPPTRCFLGSVPLPPRPLCSLRGWPVLGGTRANWEGKFIRRTGGEKLLASRLVTIQILQAAGLSKRDNQNCVLFLCTSTGRSLNLSLHLEMTDDPWFQASENCRLTPFPECSGPVPCRFPPKSDSLPTRCSLASLFLGSLHSLLLLLLLFPCPFHLSVVK